VRSPFRNARKQAERTPEVVALVAAFNEEARVAQTVEALLRIPSVSRVIVVDDGSSDAPAERAALGGACCIRLEHNRGKGGALNAGISAIRGWAVVAGTDPPDVLVADADLGASARALAELIEPVQSGRADIAIGDLPPQRGAQGFGLAMRLARWGLQRQGGAMNEPLSGQRVLSWGAIETVWPLAPGFGVEMSMSLRAHEYGLRVIELPVEVHHRPTKKDWPGLCHRARQLRAIARELLRHELRRARVLFANGSVEVKLDANRVARHNSVSGVRG
jgi:glycosyltransferase involved in cell wall biosynthesis